MKTKNIFYSMIAFCVLALSSCGPNNEDYVEKVLGNYNVVITPNINLKYEGVNLPFSPESIETNGSITKADENGNVIIKIDAINGVINSMEMTANCSGLGMKIDNSSYDGILNINSLGVVDCDFTLKNPTVTINNAKIFTWNSTVSGQGEIEYSGLPITCTASGNLNFNFTYIAE